VERGDDELRCASAIVAVSSDSLVHWVHCFGKVAKICASKVWPSECCHSNIDLGYNEWDSW